VPFGVKAIDKTTFQSSQQQGNHGHPERPKTFRSRRRRRPLPDVLGTALQQQEQRGCGPRLVAALRARSSEAHFTLSANRYHRFRAYTVPHSFTNHISLLPLLSGPPLSHPKEGSRERERERTRSA